LRRRQAFAVAMSQKYVYSLFNRRQRGRGLQPTSYEFAGEASELCVGF
jgi:hypothetical protein